ncbi:glycosyltransferase family 1 protein [Sinomonas halotolerans]|uniref:Glycosyltransferase family 1 protein n=1 Tax=Sinomonas halotolerans TaxID=1644133 RepID=A0ABU9WZF0_9MICC
MRILIDARFTRIGQHDGISRFGASLIEAVSRKAEVAMLICDERQLELLPDVPHVRVTSPLSPAELFIAAQVNGLAPDVVFCPMQTMGTWGRRYPLILTLHDLIYYEHPAPPGFLPAPVRLLWRLYHRAYWPQRLLLNRADVVATVSATTRSLMAAKRLTTRPVRIIGNAPQPGGLPRQAEVPPEKSLVYMGSFMPYKNVETVLAGMAHLPEYELHLLSRITPARRAELEAAAPPGTRVVFHGGVDEAEYSSLLHSATALVSLSRSEGYGLPLVEAMSVGTPVIASDIPIFREVGGDGASLVDPDSPAAFAAAVRALEAPGAWEGASRAALAQAEHFSWDRSADALIAAAEEARTEFRARRRALLRLPRPPR